MKQILIDDFDKYIDDIDEQPILLSCKRLVTDDFVHGISHHIDNQLDKTLSKKVISHIILTRSLFLMNYIGIYVDFCNGKFFFNHLNYEYYINYNTDDELYELLNDILLKSKYRPDNSEMYEEYRNHTRIIFDNMDKYEGKSYKSVWLDICVLSDSYFNNY